MPRFNRRDFLMGSGGALAAGAGALGALQSILPASAEEAAVTPPMVRLRPEIEPVVRWIESTPRERILEVAADELKKGLPYRELLAGIFLAGIRNVKPRPVGFKFHTVLLMNSAHQLSIDAAQQDRLYPLFWALDHFKESQEDDRKAGDWALGPPDESALPSATQAGDAFTEAMEKWDAQKADAAITSLARAGGAEEIMERFWPFAARNHRNIGHNIIFASQSFRTLGTIGWQHAEPVLRSLAFGILDGEAGEASAAPFGPSRALAPTIKKDWLQGKPDAAGTTTFLDVIRHAPPEEACKQAVAALNGGLAPDSIWDAVLLAGGEFLLKRPGIVSLHTVTSLNSMHYAYLTSGRDETRRLLLLQGVAWAVLFRDEFGVRGGKPIGADAPHLDQIEPGDSSSSPEVAQIFDQMGKDRPAAARAAFAYAKKGGSPESFMSAARSLVFRKGSEVHDFKFAVAAFEEYDHMSPAWKPHMLAASACYLKPSTAQDSKLMGRMEAASARVASPSA